MDNTSEQLERTEPRSGDALREAELSAAQQHATYTIDGTPRDRVPRGSSPDGAAERCPDCGARAGQLHVPGCAEERCPSCAGHVIACECWYGNPTSA
jgi:hypothetical protein